MNTVFQYMTETTKEELGRESAKLKEHTLNRAKMQAAVSIAYFAELVTQRMDAMQTDILKDEDGAYYVRIR